MNPNLCLFLQNPITHHSSPVSCSTSSRCRSFGLCITNFCTFGPPLSALLLPQRLIDIKPNLPPCVPTPIITPYDLCRLLDIFSVSCPSGIASRLNVCSVLHCQPFSSQNYEFRSILITLRFCRLLSTSISCSLFSQCLSFRLCITNSRTFIPHLPALVLAQSSIVINPNPPPFL